MCKDNMGKVLFPKGHILKQICKYNEDKWEKKQIFVFHDKSTSPGPTMTAEMATLYLKKYKIF